jgi:hypothetical protein
MSQFEVRKAAHETIKKRFPDEFIKEFYNGKNGLLPWGGTDNGDELYWEVNDNAWKIVVYASRELEALEYDMTMTEFLCKILNREIECEPLEEFAQDDNYFIITVS